MLGNRKVEIKTNEGFAALPADKYTVQIVDVNLVTQLKYQSTEEEEVLNYQFQILDDNPMNEEGEEGTTRGRYLWRKCRLALNSKSTLGKLAAAVEGRTLTKEEAENFDPESLVGKQVTVMVNQKPSSKDPDVIFNNIIEFMKTAKKLEPLPIEERNTEPVQKTTKTVVPVTAPDAEVDEFIKGLEYEKAQDKEEADEDDPEVLELQLKLAKAKAKAGKK